MNMACVEQQQQQQSNNGFKHYCKVCKKGFMCGRALGGHMRAHGIGDDSWNNMEEDDDDQASDWEDKVANENTSSVKRMYQLRANPNRLKSVRVCEHCGKEFFSWKSFLKHGKCGSDDLEEEEEDEESLVSSPAGSDDDFGRPRGGQGWSKRKRSFRATKFSTNNITIEDEDIVLARCLIDLANARVESPILSAEQEAESSASAEERRVISNQLPPAVAFHPPPRLKATAGGTDHKPKGLFECKACKKVFTSHQALGGHRASHKKVKGCYAAKQDQIDNNHNNNTNNSSLLNEDVGYVDNNNNNNNNDFSKTSSYQLEPSRRKTKDHECSICHRVFSTGQALGGHKRCHWITNSSANNYAPKFHFQSHQYQYQEQKSSAALDLNLPARGDDMSGGIRRDPRNPLSFEVSTDFVHLRPLSMMNNNVSRYPNHIYPDDNNDYYNNDNDGNNNNDKGNSNNKKVVDDEVDSNNKVELAKLSGLKEMSNASPWLQVGIGSTAEVGADS